MRNGRRRAPSAPAGPSARDAEPYCIVIPPPNVTGSLHMGHALNNTLQDVLCRFERMRGKDVLWQVGTDHAGIATQMVVERQLMERQQPGRRDIGREKFLEKVWAWKAESGGTIIKQLKRLGASCDWSRERFTMDEGLSRAVIKVFVELYNEGLIYKDKRLVNWDPKLLTAISDLEVQQVEVKGSLWHIKYPIEGSSTRFIVVATTRPETMLGDTAVAVHPENEKLKHLIGKHAILPLVGRRIPIVGDDYADPEKGTGAVKITPAHDFNDFEVGRRHHLPLVNVFNVEGGLDLKDNSAFLEDVAGVAGTRRHARTRRRRALRRAQEDRRTAREPGPARQDRALHPHGAARRPLGRGDRAVPDRPVVRQRQGAGGARARRGARRQDDVRAEELGEDLLRVDGEHPAVVHLAPALVGPPDSGLVRAGRQGVGGGDRGRGDRAGAGLLRRDRRAPPAPGEGDDRASREARAHHHARRGRARHLVLLGALAVLDARLARGDAGAQARSIRPRCWSPASTSSSSGSPA